MFNDDGLGEAMREHAASEGVEKLRRELSRIGQELALLQQEVALLRGSGPHSKGRGADKSPWFPKDAAPEAAGQVSDTSAEESLYGERDTLKTQQLAAQDARDRLAEHTFVLLVGIANRVQALDGRYVRAFHAGNEAMEELRSLTGRQPDGSRK